MRHQSLKKYHYWAPKMVPFPYPCYILLPGPSVTVHQLHKGHVRTKNKKSVSLNYLPQAIIEA